MKRLAISALLVVSACAGPQKAGTPKPAASGGTTATAAADPWADRKDLFVAPESTPTVKVALGAIERYTLPNGLQVIVVARKGLPSVDVSVAVKAGSGVDPLDKIGLAQFTASMLRKGTQKRSSDAIAEAIDFVGGELGAAADDDATLVNCRARGKDLGLCLDLLGDVLTRPVFPDKEMGEIRDQLNAQVEGTKDSPQALASEHAANVFFGDEDPRGRAMSKRSLGAIDRAALQAFHKTWYAPNNTIIALSGDMDTKAVKALLTGSLGGWKKHDVPRHVDKPLPRAGALQVRVVDKPDATQSSIVLAGPGIAHGSPDFYAVRLMNFSLGGGGFSSRLMKVVRSEGGKTYGASSHFSAGLDPGPFVVTTFTRNSETAKTLKLVMNEIDKMRSKGPTASELVAAKGQMIGGYGLRLETGRDLAHALLSADVVGMDHDYVEKYPARLEAVTVADTARAAASYLKPTALVVVGKAAEIKPMLADLGLPVHDVVAYTDPVSPTERRAPATAKTAQPVSPAEAAMGKKLLEAALLAKGGTALAKIKDLVLSGKGTMTMQGQTMAVTLEEFVVPGKASREELSVGPMKIVQVFADGKGFSKQGEVVRDLPPEMATAMQKSLWRDPNFILLHAAQPGAQVRGLKPVSENGVRYDVLEVIAPDGEPTRILLDAKTHLITRLVYKEDAKDSADDLADYRPEGGIAFARKTTRTGAGGAKLEISYEKIQLNRGLEPTLFSK